MLRPRTLVIAVAVTLPCLAAGTTAIAQTSGGEIPRTSRVVRSTIQAPDLAALGIRLTRTVDARQVVVTPKVRTRHPFLEAAWENASIEEMSIARSAGTLTSILNGTVIDRQTIDATATADLENDVELDWAFYESRFGAEFLKIGRIRVDVAAIFGGFSPTLTSVPTDPAFPSLTFDGTGTTFGGRFGLDYSFNEKLALYSDYGLRRASADMTSNRTSPFPGFVQTEETADIELIGQQFSVGVKRSVGQLFEIRGGLGYSRTDAELNGEFRLVNNDAGAGAGIPNQVAEILTVFTEEFDKSIFEAVLGAQACTATRRACGDVDFRTDFTLVRRVRFGFRFRF